jgi:tetratricopeptide (TPR) repeat protein
MLRFLIVFVFLKIPVSGQDPDTLLPHILAIENDTVKVNRLYTIGFDLVEKNPRLAYQYAQNCEKIALHSGSLKHISKSKNLLGMLFQTYGHYKRAVVYYEQYLTGSTSLKDTLNMAFGYTNLGSAYLRLGQFEKVEYFYLKAIGYYNALNNKKEVANGLINLAVLMHHQNQFEAALENYHKAYETGKQLNDYTIKAICLNNMAEIFLVKENYEKALAYNYDALELRELMELDADISDSHLSIAEIALKQKKTDLALENLDLAFRICNKIGYVQGKINYYKLLSELQEQKNNLQSSFENYKLYKQLNDSVLSKEGSEIAYNFEEEIEKPNYVRTEAPIKNKWLLSLLSMIFIIVPLVLIRFKR